MGSSPCVATWLTILDWTRALALALLGVQLAACTDARKRSAWEELERALASTAGVSATVHTEDLEQAPELRWVSVRIAGVDAFLVQGLTADTWVDAPQIRVAELGPYRFRHTGHGFVGVVDQRTGAQVRSEFSRDWIDVGREGALTPRMPFALNGVRDLVIHYRDAVEYCDAWRQSGGARERSDETGTFHRFVVERNDPR